MTDRSSAQPGPVRLNEDASSRFLAGYHGSISGGLWAERRRVNRDVSVPEGWDHLHDAGNFHNLELAAGLTTGEYGLEAVDKSRSAARRSHHRHDQPARGRAPGEPARRG